MTCTDTLASLLEQCPVLRVYLNDLETDLDETVSFAENMKRLPESFFEQRKSDRDAECRQFEAYLRALEKTWNSDALRADTLTILPGHSKSGAKENFQKIQLHRGQTTALVGRTGAGKSRLLEDIEWQAAGDSPTGRTILINGQKRAQRPLGQRLVAQLSQNMNFVLDMHVRDFLRMHAECFHARADAAALAGQVYRTAVSLCGEPFEETTPVTSLSGGQSRALMIADCALISQAPVVLIDEIENAGINRRMALKLLTGRDKIVFIATHDPVLALLADQRLVLSDGGIKDVMQKMSGEEEVLRKAEETDRFLTDLREKIREGQRLTVS